MGTAMNESRVTIVLPSLGEGVTEATVSRWLVDVGDDVAVDDPLLEVSTDKVDTEIASTHAGTLIDIMVAEDQAIEVGRPLAVVAVTAEPVQPETRSMSPATGQASCATTGSPQRLPRIRRVIAARMLESLHSTAQLTSVVEVDVTAVSRLRGEVKDLFFERTGTKLSFLPFFARAAIDALVEFPLLAATVNAECTEITYPLGVDLGIAVDSAKGLMVPVIRGADWLSITDLAIEIAILADKVRTDAITSDDLTGGTFTLTNTGSRGALFDTPILNTPQSGILGTGAVVERVVPLRDLDGGLTLAVRSMVYLALTYDHRIIDGADAARFLTTIKRRLESGYTAGDVLGSSAPRQ
ncbi:dihydrolipoyllysine succinyltransferase [Mycolicibacterium litorale]|nr:dihydrolipoyllysine succinyltransferase [Mycolicibacterium litorale]